ncbi:hypothetical protein WA556_005362 [Blastocystis sp. ATCC 50177/Nand II]
MSNVECLKVLLQKTKGYPVLRVPDEFLIKLRACNVHKKKMSPSLPSSSNRPMYDVLVLLLSYPEKRQTIEADAKAPIVDEDTDGRTTSPTTSTAATTQAVGAAASAFASCRICTDSATDAETSDLLCVLLADLLTSLIAELPNEDLIHLLMMRVKTHPNTYILRLCERILFISVCEIPVAPDNYIKFGLLVDDYMENRFAPLARRFVTSPRPRSSPPRWRPAFTSSDTFQLGDLTHTNPLRADDDMHLIYYIVLGFYCERQQGENLLLYALPLVYPQHHILQALATVLREYHALFIFNRYDSVLLFVVNETPCMQYYYEEYVKKDTCDWVEQIQLEKLKVPEEKNLVTSVNKNYYYQKLLPLVISDAVKEVCLKHQKKILKKRVIADVRECEGVDVLLKEAESSKCLEIGWK